MLPGPGPATGEQDRRSNPVVRCRLDAPVLVKAATAAVAPKPYNLHPSGAFCYSVDMSCAAVSPGPPNPSPWTSENMVSATVEPDAVAWNGNLAATRASTKTLALPRLL